LSESEWSREHPGARVVPKMASTPARDYSNPSISRVPVVVEADHADFSPPSCDRDGFSRVLANIPSGGLFIPKGGMATIDCGFTMKLPPGYRCGVTSDVHGLLVDIVDSKKFKVNVVNVGDDTTVKDRDVVGRLWVEPIYLFEWRMKG